MAVRPTPPAASSSGTPSLVPQGAHLGQPAMPLGRPVTIVGSRHRSHLHLVSRSISKAHALIVSTDAGHYIRDLASRTHVIVNGKPVKEAVLRNRDEIKIGSFTFKYSDPLGRGALRAVNRAAGAVPDERAPAAVLDVDGAEMPLPIEDRTVLIGRRPTCDIPLTENSVSTSHAVIFELNGKRYVRDLGSRTGTFVNGEAVHQQVIELGDTLKVGDTEIRYKSAAEAGQGL